MGPRRLRLELIAALALPVAPAGAAQPAQPVLRLTGGTLVVDGRHIPSALSVEIRRDRHQDLYVLDFGGPGAAPRLRGAAVEGCRGRRRGVNATGVVACAGRLVERVEVRGGAGADRIFVGVPVSSVVRAGDGRDTIGRPEYQVSASLEAIGGKGDDAIHAWGLDDRVDAGPGDDVVELATVTPRHPPRCGEGIDVVYGFVLPATYGCEERQRVPVSRLPSVSRPPRPETSAPSPVAAARGLVALGARGAGVELGCPSLPFTADCAVVLRLERLDPRASRLANGSALLYAGQHETVGLRLTPAGRRLARRGAFTARLTVAPIDGRTAPARFHVRFDRRAQVGRRGVLDLADDLHSAPLPTVARPPAPDAFVAVRDGILEVDLSAAAPARAAVRRLEDAGAYAVAARGAAVAAGTGCRLVAGDTALCAQAGVDAVSVRAPREGGAVAVDVPVPVRLEGASTAAGPAAPPPVTRGADPPTSEPLLALVRPRLARLGSRRLLADVACVSSPTSSCATVLEVRDLPSRRLLGRARLVLGLERRAVALELSPRDAAALAAGTLRRALVGLTATAAEKRYAAGAVLPVR